MTTAMPTGVEQVCTDDARRRRVRELALGFGAQAREKVEDRLLDFIGTKERLIFLKVRMATEELGSLCADLTFGAIEDELGPIDQDIKALVKQAFLEAFFGETLDGMLSYYRVLDRRLSASAVSDWTPERRAEQVRLQAQLGTEIDQLETEIARRTNSN